MTPRALFVLAASSLFVCLACKKPRPDPVARALERLDQRLREIAPPEALGEGLPAPPPGIRLLLSATSLEITGLAALAEIPEAQREGIFLGRGLSPAALGWIRGRTVALPNLRVPDGAEAPAVLVPELRDGLQSLVAWRPPGSTETLPISLWIGRDVSYRQADVVLGAVARAGYHSLGIGLTHNNVLGVVVLSLPSRCGPGARSPRRCAVSELRVLPAGYLLRAQALNINHSSCLPSESEENGPTAELDPYRLQPPALPTVMPTEGSRAVDGVRDWVGRVMFGPHKECPTVPRGQDNNLDPHTLAAVARDVSAIAPGCELATVRPTPATPWREVAQTVEALRAEALLTVRLGRPEPRAEHDCVGAVRPGEVIPER